MAKRHARRKSPKTVTRVAKSESLKALEQQVIAIAEQVGRIAASAQAKADSWGDQPGFQSRLARIRDRASNLLSRLGAQSLGRGDGRMRARKKSREKVAAPAKNQRERRSSGRPRQR